MKRNACQKCVFAVRDDNPHCGLRGFRSDFNVEWCESENDKVPNGYELQEDGYFSWVHKKKEYPKTYEECCKVLDWNHRDYDRVGYKSELLCKLQVLLLCRDAYWKIAGEEMGLGKPWEPDYDSGVNKFGIICLNGVVQESNPTTNWERHLNKVLDFPTEEMRDAFYENFKELIEQCKALL